MIESIPAPLLAVVLAVFAALLAAGLVMLAFAAITGQPSMKVDARGATFFSPIGLHSPCTMAWSDIQRLEVDAKQIVFVGRFKTNGRQRAVLMQVTRRDLPQLVAAIRRHRPDLVPLA